MMSLMEFLSDFSFWEYLTCYLLGMVFVGFPMGLFSLKACKDPSRKILGFILFPFSAFEGKVGRHSQSNMVADMEVGTETLSIDSKENLELRAEYIFVTMILYPGRLLQLVGLYFVVLMLTIFYDFPPLVGKGLLVLCKKCMRI